MRTLKEIQAEILKFRDDRDWKQFHNPKDIAISLNLEAAELLEIFQWSGKDLTKLDCKKEIAEEIADVLIYCLLMADASDIDIEKAVTDKIKANNDKYPVSKCAGSSKKYTEL